MVNISKLNKIHNKCINETRAAIFMLTLKHNITINLLTVCLLITYVTLLTKYELINIGYKSVRINSSSKQFTEA